MLKIIFFLILINYNYCNLLRLNKFYTKKNFIDNDKQIKKDIKFIIKNPSILNYKNKNNFKLNKYFKSLFYFDKKINYFFNCDTKLNDDYLNINNKNMSLINYTNNDSHIMWVVFEDNNLFKKGDIVCFEKKNFNNLNNIYNNLDSNVTIYKMNYNINNQIINNKLLNNLPNEKNNFLIQLKQILTKILYFVQSEFRFFINIQILKIKILFNIKIIHED